MFKLSRNQTCGSMAWIYLACKLSLRTKVATLPPACLPPLGLPASCHCPPWIHASRGNPVRLQAAGRCAPHDPVSEIGHFAATIQASPEICRRQHGAKRVRTLVYARRLPHARSRGFSPSPTCCLEAGCSQRRRLHCRAILR